MFQNHTTKDLLEDFGVIFHLCFLHFGVVYLKLEEILMLLLGFGEKNPGMIRVLLGDALWLEDERLQERILQIFERIESSLKQSLRIAQTQGRLTQSSDGQEVSARAAMMMSYVVGRWHRYARSGFKKSPTEFNELPMRVLFSA